MQLLPDLTVDERAQLTESIRRDGVQYPVLVDGRGEVIDGFHRQAVCAELGVACPREVRDVDPETATRLRITLNVARRHLSETQQAELLAPVVEKLWKAEVAASAARRTAGGAKGRETQMASGGPLRKPSKNRGLETRDLVRKKLNAELPAGAPPISHRQVMKAHAYAQLPETAKAEVRAGTKAIDQAVSEHKAKGNGKVPDWKLVEQERNRQLREQQARIRASYEESQLASMHNAPVGKLNLPLIRRLDSIYEQLAETKALDPVGAAAGLPPERLSVFGLAEAEWLLAFATAVEARRVIETPGIAPRQRRRHEILNPVVAGSERVVVDEANMTRIERRILAYLREQGGPARTVVIAKALGLDITTISPAMRALRAANLIVGTRDGRTVSYELIRS